MKGEMFYFCVIWEISIDLYRQHVHLYLPHHNEQLFFLQFCKLGHGWTKSSILASDEIVKVLNFQSKLSNFQSKLLNLNFQSKLSQFEFSKQTEPTWAEWNSGHSLVSCPNIELGSKSLLISVLCLFVTHATLIPTIMKQPLTSVGDVHTSCQLKSMK